mmetsp:Transcript_2190/g.6150  ORF Transcript_2190/g.6150 Transcript_2190/m.6150 type:complete len:851 (+) Transcript_2190:99-2651(+)
MDDVSLARDRFERNAGRSEHAAMSPEAFIADMLQRGVPVETAQDMLSSLGIPNEDGIPWTAYKFAVLALAQPATAPTSPAELRAVSNAYAQRSARDLIRDLAASPGHVAWLEHAIAGMETDACAQVAAPQLLAPASAPLSRMRGLGLEPGALLRAPHRKRRRVVYDGRMSRAAYVPSSVAQAQEYCMQHMPEADVDRSHGCPPLAIRVASERVGSKHIAEEHCMTRSPRRAAGVAHEMTTPSRWRGPLAPARDSLAFQVSQTVVFNAQALAPEAALSPGHLPSGTQAWPGEPSALLLNLLGFSSAAHAAEPVPCLHETGRETSASRLVCALQALFEACALILRAQPPVVRARAPAKVLGGPHGRLADMLALLHTHGFPSSQGPGGDVEMCSYVMCGGLLPSAVVSGDGVQEPPLALECAVVAAALKVAYPARVWLVRGPEGSLPPLEAALPRWAGSPGPPGRAFAGAREELQEHKNADHDARAAPGDAGMLARACARAVFGSADARHGESCARVVLGAFGCLPSAALVGGEVLVLAGGVGAGAWGLCDLEEAAGRAQGQAASAPASPRGSRAPARVHPAALVDALMSRPAPQAGGGQAACGPPLSPGACPGALSQTLAAAQSPGEGKVRARPSALHFSEATAAEFCRREGISLLVHTGTRVPEGFRVSHGGRVLSLSSARTHGTDKTPRSGGADDVALVLIAEDEEGCLRVRAKVLAAGAPSVPPGASTRPRAQLVASQGQQGHLYTPTTLQARALSAHVGTMAGAPVPACDAGGTVPHICAGGGCSIASGTTRSTSSSVMHASADACMVAYRIAGQCLGTTPPSSKAMVAQAPLPLMRDSLYLWTTRMN